MAIGCERVRRVNPGVGETFGGYTIQSVLGRGGMGTVYLATHERLARNVALKVIAPELADDEDFRARFLRESQLAASLDDPNVIPIYDADEVDGVLFLAMRYVSGPSLQALLRERGRLSPEETLRIAEQIGGALDAAHRAGLVHRDVKPANILLAEPGDHAYLCDFGLAKRTSSKGVTRTGFFLGTVDYCAPEQIQGGPLDGRADVYSLGSVLFHCLAGQPPYRGRRRFAVLQRASHRSAAGASRVSAPSLPLPLDDVIATAMAKDPDARHPTAARSSRASQPRSGHAPDEAYARGADTTAARRALIRRPPRPAPRATGAACCSPACSCSALGRGGVVAVLATRGSHGGPSADRPPSGSSGRSSIRSRTSSMQSAAGRREIAATLGAGLNCSISARGAAADRQRGRESPEHPRPTRQPPRRRRQTTSSRSCSGRCSSRSRPTAIITTASPPPPRPLARYRATLPSGAQRPSTRARPTPRSASSPNSTSSPRASSCEPGPPARSNGRQRPVRCHFATRLTCTHGPVSVAWSMRQPDGGPTISVAVPLELGLAPLLPKKDARTR